MSTVFSFNYVLLDFRSFTAALCHQHLQLIFLAMKVIMVGFSTNIFVDIESVM